MPLTDAQKEIAQSNARFKVVAAGRRFGKALAVGTPILTTDGWKTMLDIKVGDEVFGSRGFPIEVTGVTEVMENRDVYRVSFSDNNYIDADGEHLWYVQNRKYRRKKAAGADLAGIPTIYTTKELLDRGVLYPRTDGGIEKNFAIPTCGPLQYEDMILGLDPYSLGYWIGNGIGTTARFTIPENDIEEVVENFAYPLWRESRFGAFTFGLMEENGCKLRGEEEARIALQELGVLNQKQIPKEYFEASIPQRLNLLQGLMDSDGHVSKLGSCEFCSANEVLARGVVQLLQGLGVKCTFHVDLVRCGLTGKAQRYRINFTTDLPVFRLHKYLGRLYRRPKKRSEIHKRYISSIERIDSVPVKCIEVDAEDHLYLAGEALIPTHNSFLSLSLMAKAARHPKSQVWYVTTTYSAAKTIMWSILKEKLRKFRWAKSFHEVAMQAHLVNGSVISLKGANNPDSLRGIGLNYLVMDEASYIDERVWTEVLRPTLSDKQGEGLFISSPSGRNWFYDLWMLGQNLEEEDWESWQFTTLEGGNVPPDEIEAARRDLDARTFEQEYEAQFVTYTGLVYYGFSYQENVIDRPYDPDDPVYIGMDFNIDPMTATVFQLDDDGETLYLVDEIEIFGSNTDEMAEEILCRYPEQKIRIYPDPACVQTRTSAGGRTDLSILQSYGFQCKFRRKHPLVRDRINAVNSRLCAADGVRRLLVHRGCKRVIHALERHSYKRGTNLPEKGGEGDLSHMTDSIGYLVEYMFPVAKQEMGTSQVFGV